MAAARLNLMIEQGATWAHRFVVHQPAPVNTPLANLLPMDLAGYSARMQVRTHFGGTVLLELTTDNGRITIDDADGTIDLLLSATDTADLDFDTGVYDLEIQNSDGFVSRLVQGNITLSREVTA